MSKLNVYKKNHTFIRQPYMKLNNYLNLYLFV